MIILRYITQLATILRDLRDARNVPQETLAFAAGVDGAQVSKYERGVVVPTFPILLRLLRCLGHELVIMPKMYADTAAQRNAVIVAATRYHFAENVTGEELATAVQQLVAAELAWMQQNGRP